VLHISTLNSNWAQLARHLCDTPRRRKRLVLNDLTALTSRPPP
jgi:hypothetical protein